MPNLSSILESSKYKLLHYEFPMVGSRQASPPPTAPPKKGKQGEKKRKGGNLDTFKLISTNGPAKNILEPS